LLLTHNVQGYLVDFGFGVGRLRRVRPVFFCCVVGVRVLTTDFAGEAVGAGVGVANAAGVGVGVANAAGVGGIAAGVFVAGAGTYSGVGRTYSGVGLFAIPNRIATTVERITTAERIPTAIAKRARR